MTTIHKCRAVYRVMRNGDIVIGHGRRRYTRPARKPKARAWRVTDQGREYVRELEAEREVMNGD